MPSPVRALAGLPWLLPTLFAAAAWFLATVRIMRRSGAEEAALAAGMIVAFAIAVTVWRSGRGDLERSTLAAGLCPRCRRSLPGTHEHASTRSLADGLVHWRCDHCGYHRSEALTCPSCEP